MHVGVKETLETNGVVGFTLPAVEIGLGHVELALASVAVVFHLGAGRPYPRDLDIDLDVVVTLAGILPIVVLKRPPGCFE